MGDWFRSFGVIGAAFGGVLGATLLLAQFIVPPAAGRADEPGPSSEPVAASAGPPGEVGAVGGQLTVVGDLEGTLVLARESAQERYSLVGDDGRVSFEGSPTSVAQASFQGWEFFPEPEDCTVTPGTLDSETGIASATLECRDLPEVRDKGVVSMSGTLGIAGDVLGLRGDLPSPGGGLSVGDETWEFEYAFMTTWRGGPTGDSMELVDEARAGILRFAYDVQTHRISLTEVLHDDQAAEAPANACQIDTDELGKVNPRTTVIDMAVRCSAVEVPGLGSVPIRGSIIVEQLEISF